MKKILLAVLMVAALSYSNQTKAQCSGGNIEVFNVVITNNPAIGTYNFSYQYKYLLGNASIQVVLKCGGTVVATSDCKGDLRKEANGVSGYIGSGSGTLTLPDPNCVGVKEIEIRIYASSNCNGTFCALPQNIPLPVHFKSFNAARNNSAVSLKWETASEQNNTGFAVERNTRGTWEQVAFIPSQATGGNSDALLTYIFSEVNSERGISQYRIKQIDIDAKSSYSEVRAIRGVGQSGKTNVYPNPSTNGRVSVVFEDATVTRDISVMDMSGRVVKQFRGITNNNIQIENLNAGMYSIKISVPATGEQTMEKIIVNKR